MSKLLTEKLEHRLPTQSSPLRKSNLRRSLWRGAVALGSLGLTVSFCPVSLAANRIDLDYGSVQRTLSADELQAFAKTNKPQGVLAELFSFAELNADKMHDLLTKPIPMKTATMEHLVNSYLGEVLLGQVGSVILPATGGDAIKNLKTGLVKGIQNDQISVLSFIQSYPDNIRVDGKRLVAISNQVTQDAMGLPEIMAGLDGIKAKFFPSEAKGVEKLKGAVTPQSSSAPASPTPTAP